MAPITGGVPATSSADPVSTPAEILYIPQDDFLPSYVMILILSFIILFSLCIFLFELTYPRQWANFVSAPLFSKR